LHTDERIGTHPFDFTAQSSETVEMIWFVSKVNQNDIWLIVASAAKPSESEATESVSALALFHFADPHSCTSDPSDEIGVFT